MRKPDLYFIITRKCSARCKHCYLDAGPEHRDTTISKKDFKKVIDNLPKISLSLCLSGGEVFSIKDKLFDYLKYIQEENDEREFDGQGKIKVELQTNGFWAVDDDKIKSVLFDLLSLDVKDFDITSMDKYHREQGIKTKNLKKLSHIISGSGLFDHFSLRGAPRGSLMPIGRAEKMNLDNRPLYYSWSCKDVLDDYRLGIREDGSVYFCCYDFLKLPGNLTKEPLTEIVRKAKKDERLSIVNAEGIKGLMVHDGWKKRDVKHLIDTYGECGLCYRIYKSRKK